MAVSVIVPCHNAAKFLADAEKAGAKDAKDIIIEIWVAANPDGTVREARIVSTKGSEESFTQAAADSALRAVRNPRCSPLKLPPEKYNSWKTFTLVFNPREML